MNKIEIISIEDLDGNIAEHVLEEFAPGKFRSTPKEIWDTQEADKQTGTIS